MYIIFFEDLTIKSVNRLTENDLSEHSELCDIIDISNPKKPMYYGIDGKWHAVEKYEYNSHIED